MIKKTTTILKVFLLLLFTTNTFSQNFEWANRIGSATHDEGEEVVVDNNGNVYAIGYFKGILEFDQPNIPQLESNGDRDILIQKMDSNGSLIWAKHIGGTEEDLAASMVIDNSDNLYITGSFRGTMDFDPGTGQTLLSSQGEEDIFVLKMNSDGDLLWAKGIGGTGKDGGNNLALDSAGYVYTTGEYVGSVDFDLGAGEAILTTTARLSFFMQKLDTKGNLIWAKDFGFTPEGAIAISANGDIYRTGYYSGTVDFDPGAGETILSPVSTPNAPGPLPDAFIQKLDANADLIWVKSYGGPGFEVGASIGLDANGYVYTTGGFEGTIDFDLGPKQVFLTAKANNPHFWLQTMFIQKLDEDGNLIWAKASDVTPDVSMKIDDNGNIYRTGYFLGTQDFDPGSATVSLTTKGGAQGDLYDGDTFIQKLDTNGNFVWVSSVGGKRDDFSYSIALDGNNIYTTGFFGDTVDFNPEIGSFDLKAKGSGDIFVQKLSEVVKGTGSEEDEMPIVFPNPADKILHLSMPDCQVADKDGQITILDANGIVIPITPIVSKNSKACLDFEVRELVPGLYFVKIRKGDQVTILRFIKK
ncbi:T9SS type A sorting domain-containing protein [Flavivirga eckloniae]|uniref:Secretion system C-terminal sorting domain-containing protein n=1 Tax=Flavivirga eckloniae TaxID=1803846 RepID=A0A2K9PL21_9FLAO|nr:T9SS type A sorting domain-containing protein [Flavivirga eckloniae]AUP77750.1 hypothetical protein C1H87_03070 [Flavivirga eckloniae]